MPSEFQLRRLAGPAARGEPFVRNPPEIAEFLVFLPFFA